MDQLYYLISIVSKYMIPMILVSIPAYAVTRQVPIYESFVEGAKEGFPTAIQLIPHLVGMIVAVSIFRETGALTFYLNLLEPITHWLQIPSEVLPVGLLRPISGSGSLAFVESIMKTYGPDSFLGKLASTIQGSTDTTFYVCTVYFGAVGIRQAGYALKVGLWADLIGFLSSCLICSLIFQ